MNLQTNFLRRIIIRTLAWVPTAFALAAMTARACTIFVLTDTNRALFCNNEDWSDPKTRIWFQPGGDGYHGAVYVGFDNGWAQGGLNTEGLAYDWVAGYTEEWKPDPHATMARGNSSQRMLETCATVNDAIAFYRTHDEPGFAGAKILVADRAGASVIIGVRDGKVQVYPDNRCRGFGFGRRILDQALAGNPEPTVSNGFKILRDCRQSGDYATKYSNIYDLKSGDIFLYPFPDRDDEVKLNLADELKKGGHYYQMRQIQEQLAQTPRPLPLNMKRFPMDEFKPITDKEPDLTSHHRAMIRDMMEGTARAEDYKAEAWKVLSPMQKAIQDELKPFGDLMTMTLVDRTDANGQRSYRYRVDFAKGVLLVRYLLDGENKVASAETEDIEWKPGARLAKAAGKAVVGIGVMLRLDGQNVVIDGTVPNSPAAATKDIQAGDRIVAVAQEDGPAVPIQSDKQAAELIRGEIGTTVRLTIRPAGKDDTPVRVVNLVRAQLERPPY